jgi:acyl-ACP thioesterase
MVHVAADENASELGTGFREMSANGQTFVLQRFSVRALRMPEYGETVRIRTWPDGTDRGTFIRKGDFFDTSGKKIMEWASLWILFDLIERKILRPSALKCELPFFNNHDVEFSPQKIILPQDGLSEISRHAHTVRYADVDTNNHMNNSIYADLVFNALDAMPWTEIHINYLAEAKQGEEINIAAYMQGDNFYVIGKKNPSQNCFSARVV